MELEIILSKLSHSERLFCEYFMSDINGKGRNATQAAIKAGYSEKTARVKASQLRAKPEIAEYIKYLEQEQIEQLGITKHDYMVRINNWSQFNLFNYIVVLGEQTTIGDSEPVWRWKYLHELTELERTCIKGIRKNSEGNFDGYDFNDHFKSNFEMLKIMLNQKSETEDDKTQCSSEDVQALTQLMKVISNSELPVCITGGENGN